MLISRELNDAINAQIGRELGAGHQYINIATHFDGQGLRKFAEFFYKQAEEEREHAMKFIKYIVDAGGEVHIPPVEAPQSNFKSAEEAVELSLRWERDVTQQIFNLMDIAMQQKDYIARQFLDWYTNEQLEEVSSMDNLLRVVRLAGEKNIIMLEAYISHGG